VWICTVLHRELTSEALKYGSHSCYTAKHTLPRSLPKGRHDWMNSYSTSLLPYSFIDPVRIKGWVGLVGWPTADGLPIWLMVTHQLQVRCRPVKVRRSDVLVLPLSYTTTYTTTTVPSVPPGASSGHWCRAPSDHMWSRLEQAHLLPGALLPQPRSSDDEAYTGVSSQLLNQFTSYFAYKAVEHWAVKYWCV